MTNIDAKKTNQAVVQVLQDNQDETTIPTTPQVDPILVHRPSLPLRTPRRIPNTERETTTTGRDATNHKNAAVLNSVHLTGVVLKVVGAVPTARTIAPFRGTTITKAKESTAADNADPIQKDAINPAPHLPTK